MKAAAEEEIRAAIEIFQQVWIKSTIFVPPQWKLVRIYHEVLRKVGFLLAEMQEEFFQYSCNSLRKINSPGQVMR